MDFIETRKYQLRKLVKWSKWTTLFVSLLFSFVIFSTLQSLPAILSGDATKFQYMAFGSGCCNIFFMAIIWMDGVVEWISDKKELAHYDRISNESTIQEFEKLYREGYERLQALNKKLNPIPSEP